jgi:HD superfamily phosphohydrolase
MYWQVYLHKTTVSAEKMLINLIQRSKKLAQAGVDFTVTEEFGFFMKNDFNLEDFKKDKTLLENFLSLDDFDIWGAIKLWKRHDDYVLRNISQMFLTRNLFKINLVNEPFSASELEEMKVKTLKKLQIPETDIDYFFSSGTVSNYGYLAKDRINILTKKGKVMDVAMAADLPNIKVMSKIVEKHYVCKAKSLILNH